MADNLAILKILEGFTSGINSGIEKRRANQIEDQKLAMLEQEAALTREARELDIGSARRKEVDEARANLRKQKGQMADTPESDMARKAYGHYGLKVRPSDTEESLHLAYGPLSAFAKTIFEEEEKRKTERSKGAADPTKDIKDNQWKAAGFARRMELALEDMDQIRGSGYEREGKIQGVLAYTPEAFKPENLKAQTQAEENFLMAVLRKQSGASISNEEMRRGEKMYFPREGDSQRTLAQKANARHQELVNMMSESGKALAHTPAIQRMPIAQKKQSGGGVGLQEAAALEMPDFDNMGLDELNAYLGGK